jgi:hypothetical protein
MALGLEAFSVCPHAAWDDRLPFQSALTVSSWGKQFTSYCPFWNGHGRDFPASICSNDPASTALVLPEGPQR